MNIFEECAKCHNDFVYFAEKYIKISHPKRGLIPFKLYDFHKHLIKEYDGNRFVITKKFRQGGFTTLTAIYGLWDCLFHLDRKWLFIAKTDREAIEIGRMIKRAVEHLPEQMKSFLTHQSDHEKKFGVTGSVMRFMAAQAVCGTAVTHLVIDEAAFVPNMSEHWNGLYPTLLNDGKCFVLSTVNGIGNWFYDMWTSAVEKKNSFHPVHIHYTEHPDYSDPKWVEQMKKNLGERGFLQEIEGAFISKYDSKWHAKQQKKQQLIKMICELFDDEDQ